MANVNGETLLLIASSLERRSKELWSPEAKKGLNAIDLAANGGAAVALKHTAESIREHIKKCDTCGKTFHPDWGKYCPDCTGAS